MAVLTDPIVSVMLTEFNEAVSDLVLAKSSGHIEDSQRLDVVRQLCELSRDTFFHLGPVEYADREQLREISESFFSAAKLIPTVWEHSPSGVPDAVELYCQNIEERARHCRL